MTAKTTRFVHIYHPDYLGGDVYAISQANMFETIEKVIQVAERAAKSGELLHDCIKVEWTPEMDEHEYSVPEGHTVRFLNVVRPYHRTPESYAAGQVGLYATAEDAKRQADRIRKGFWMFDYYIAVAVPVIFKGLSMQDGWAKNDKVNYDAVHREELQEVDLMTTEYPPEIKAKYNL